MGNGRGAGSGPEPSTLDPCAHLDPHMEGLLVLSNQVYFSDIVCRFPEEGKKILFFFSYFPKIPNSQHSFRQVYRERTTVCNKQ